MKWTSWFMHYIYMCVCVPRMIIHYGNDWIVKQKFQSYNVHAFETRVAGIFQSWNDFQLWRGKMLTHSHEYHVCVLKRGMFQSVLFASDRNWMAGCEQNRLFLDIHWAVFAIQRKKINTQKLFFFFEVFFCVFWWWSVSLLGIRTLLIVTEYLWRYFLT